VKCPKCSYLGFDTGDRCKNCGYDFSLVPADGGPGEAEDDLVLRPAADLTADAQWDDSFDQAMTALASFPDISESMPPTPDPAVTKAEPAPAETAPEPAEAARTDRGLPLFTEAFDDFGEEPLIKVPATPRPPLAVRRTPRTPRLRVVPKVSRTVAAEPALELWDTAPDAPLAWSVPELDSVSPAAAAEPQSRAAEGGDVSGPARRLGAVALDHVLLFAIDLSVMYFTLRMVGLPMADWRALPLAPLAAFLLLVKLSYFWAFTAVGGQTIGKMATRIRVVTMERAPVDGACALTRALAGAVSASVLGLGYLPALAGPERLALHDYVTHTRVIVLP
jgi:uncharacterized RDD family membrane protein YckC